MKKQIQRETSNMFWAILGVACYAAAYRWFLVPVDLYSGGFTGVSQLVKLLLEEGLGLHVPESIERNKVSSNRGILDKIVLSL